MRTGSWVSTTCVALCSAVAAQSWELIEASHETPEPPLSTHTQPTSQNCEHRSYRSMEIGPTKQINLFESYTICRERPPWCSCLAQPVTRQMVASPVSHMDEIRPPNTPKVGAALRHLETAQVCRISSLVLVLASNLQASATNQVKMEGNGPVG